MSRTGNFFVLEVYKPSSGTPQTRHKMTISETLVRFLASGCVTRRHVSESCSKRKSSEFSLFQPRRTRGKNSKCELEQKLQPSERSLAVRPNWNDVRGPSSSTVPGLSTLGAMQTSGSD